MFSFLLKKSHTPANVPTHEKAPVAEVANKPSAFFDVEDEFWLFHEMIQSETMTSIERQYILWSAVRHITRNAISGDFENAGFGVAVLVCWLR